MNIKEERMGWKQDAPVIESLVNGMVEHLKNANAEPVAYMAVDIVFRAYLHWLHSAQVNREDPAKVRNSVIHLQNTMVLELLGRMAAKDEEGKKISLVQWAQEFVNEATEELSQDINILVNRREGGIQ